MARKAEIGINQKLKMLYLVKIFTEETDENHALTVQQIIEKLDLCGVFADRRTLYDDFEHLRHFGFDIVKTAGGRNRYYHLEHRLFEIPELKLLVDSVQSARFITNKKSAELIRKLESLASRHDARQLHRQVTITGRIKTMNESIYYNVDRLHEAIALDLQIQFQYFQWNEHKEMVPRHNGKWYRISPWMLISDKDNYYLIGYDSNAGKIKHFRVDKMLTITIFGCRREGREQFREFNLPKYSNSLFGMFGGKETRVTLEASNDMAGIIIDRFGKEIHLIITDDDHFRTTVNVAVSNQFFGWVLSLGDGIKLIGPDWVTERLREEIRRLCRKYDIDALQD